MTKKLTPEQIRANLIDRMMDTAKQYELGNYLADTVAPTFQLMIRTEAAAKDQGYEYAMRKGRLAEVKRHVGENVCITCGKAKAYRENRMDAGHYLSRARACLILEPKNVHPQCKWCNGPFQNGRAAEYRAWMIWTYGEEVVEELERRHRTEVHQWTKYDLVVLLIEYRERIRAAELAIDQKLASGGGPGAYCLPYLKP